jgi:hypothetical protein
MNFIILLNIILLTTSYVYVNGILKIPFQKITKYYKEIKYPSSKNDNIEVFIKENDSFDTESGEIPLELDIYNITKSNKNIKTYSFENIDNYHLAMVMMI